MIRAMQVQNATEAGRAWAEQKADALGSEIAAEQWPDVWDPRWIDEEEVQRCALLAGAEADTERALNAFRATAHHAAAEHWIELLTQLREEQDVVDWELDDEALAVKLVQALERDLPQGLSVDHDGPRVYLSDEDGTERTVTSLAQAWRAVAEWRESKVL